MPLAPGAVLQVRYQIIEQLGAGGMSTVYKARDLRLRRHIAVKENLRSDPALFENEALLLAELHHPNLPAVYDHFVEPDGRQYLVMAFIGGQDLEAHRVHGPLPEAEVLRWFEQVLSAVEYLHEHGVIHRDIKPGNIKLTPQGRIVLVDFGIAKRHQAGVPTMIGAQGAGTQGCAPPEQYRGGTDQRSDIYSLGATLYALLTGSWPPDALDLETGRVRLSQPRRRNPALQGSTEAVILKAMQLEPNSRYQTVSQMQHALAHPGLPSTRISMNTPTVSADADTYFHRGNDAYSEGDYQRAIANYTQAITLQPDDDTAFNNRGASYKAQGDYQRAIADYTQAIKLNPHDAADTFYNRGTIYKAQGDYQRAIADYTQAIKLNPHNAVDAFYNRGIAYSAQGDYQRAIADYTQALALQSDDADTFYSRGAAYAAQSDYQRAIADYTQAIALQPNDADAFYNRGNAYSAQGDYQRAIIDYTQAILLRPDDPEFFNNRGNAYSDQGDYQRAIANHTQAIKLNPNFAVAFYNRGNAYKIQKDYQRAIADYTQAIKLDPNNAATFVCRGLAYYEKKDYQRAITDYNQAIKLNSYNVFAFFNRGLVYKAQGETIKASIDFKQVLELSNDDGLRKKAQMQLAALAAH
jgi:tetratricopeptide (TPR) repeat protein/tRNA A-37 threonylcarbamoyl transferase component Bud32